MGNGQPAPGLLNDLLHYLKAFTNGWFQRITGPVMTVIFLVAGTFLSGRTRELFFLAAAICLFSASFKVWRDQEKKIRSLLTRPYDQEKQKLARRILAQLTPDQRDLLRYHLQFGELKYDQIMAESGLPHAAFGPIFTGTASSQLLARAETPRIGRAGVNVTYSIPPEFREVLRDELFPRREASPRRLFLKAMPE